MNSWPKLSILYNVEHGDTKVYIFIFSQLFRQLSYYSTGAGTSRILKDKIIKICNENMIKTAYYDEWRYNFFEPSDNKNKDIMN